jgi:hypothetical protein
MARDAQLAMLERLFEAHLGPIRDDMREVKEASKQSYAHAEQAHKRIDKHENRFLGLMAGVGIGGGAFGAWLQKTLPSLFS